ncbi:ATP-binding cassette domain-containing protein [Rhizobium leguminosarum]|uniref:galactofuranose ABC transporter, ATP-binding protein YtfR n=1 Tax=Rhizobium ruizarguesonis TaxID=2081791 RepID=UPI00041AAB3A|nr:galactofuranose ABC transporter, ATP-binding protein YtfR [Rhizobium ruizarguesonis]MBY5807231.1 sugar ABC transporter ATP-binding protein [Rhizobium leguminosarum]NKL27388.1 ATP-binding cassette domain-containing protein [Rhizobium leguminosarum bv. viciae]MBY5847331.1 sugar ABC transporter ATP-binding protein [Rhizobium leguminosarum]NEH87267.1 ATP-binding cassette domain-containing protein [Rhizobium ruizarguesonis]NEI12236.1 ATP-binding cassette domain-containing protein [Rhizobium ruiz
MTHDFENVLAASGISKFFPGAVALDKVDFTLRRGEVHALLGENGAGKSTLIKCITGAYHRDEGSLALDGQEINPANTLAAQKLGIGTVYQEVNLLANLSVAENLFLGRQPRRFGMTDVRAMNRKARDLLAGYGVDIDVTAELGRFSVAVQQVVAIARAVDLSGKVLILDEPTASLDNQEVALLFRIIEDLKKRGLGIVFITHFLEQVYAISDRITVLRNGKLVGTRDAADLPRQGLIAMMLGRELAHVEETVRERSLAAGDVRYHFAGYGKRGKVKPFDLEVRAGEVVGVAGLLGSGRTETAELLFGIEHADSGSATIDGQPVTISSPRAAIGKGFGFCPEDRKTDGIIGDLSIRENIALALQARRGWTRPLSRAEQNALADRYIKALDIRTTDREKPIRLLSGGNQQKAILARWLATNPKFLILDEPTRGIDVGAHAEIIRLIEELCAGGMSLIVISSELEELVAYSSRVIVLRDRQHIAELTGERITAAGIVEAIAAAEHKMEDA